MKTLTLLIALTLTSSCGKQEKPSPSKESKPETWAEWIQSENAKKTPCKMDDGLNGWLQSGGNGFESYSANCKDGVVVLTDTTADFHKMLAEQYRRRDDLAEAAVTRCLTADEFKDFADLGYRIYVRDMQPFREEDLRDRYHAALLTQQILRQKCPKVTE